MQLSDGKCTACSEFHCPPGYFFDLCDKFRDSRCLRCSSFTPDNAKYTLAVPFNADACGWECEEGYERGDGDGAGCVACAVGFFRHRGVMQCTPCPYPTTSGGVGSRACDICKQGYFRRGISHDGHVLCQQCPSHTTTLLSRQGQALDSSACFCGPGYAGYSWRCYPCPTGSYKETISVTPDTEMISYNQSSDPSDLCQLCPAGSFSWNIGAADKVTCIACPANSISGPGSCQDQAGFLDSLGDGCDAYAETPSLCGKWATDYKNVKGVHAGLACCICGGGYAASSSGSDECVCAPGYFDIDPGKLAMCLACPENTFSALIGAVGSDLCNRCSDGNAYSAAASTAEYACMCNAGYEEGGRVGAAVTCTPCPADTYATLADAFCLACPEGTKGIPGSNSQLACKCLAGSYGSVAEGLPCTVCPDNALSSSSNNRLVSDCYCDADHGWVGLPTEECQRCAENQWPWMSTRYCSCNAGYYGARQDYAVCMPCPAHSSSNIATEMREGCRCLSNWYGNLSEPAAKCAACPEHSRSSSAFSVADCACNAGYERIVESKGMPACRKCPKNAFSWTPSQCSCNAGFFLDTNATTINASQPDASSFVCGSCESGTYNQLHSQEGKSACVACPANSSGYPHVISRSSILDCYCHLGFSRKDILTCSPCPPGTYGLLDTRAAAVGGRNWTQELANTNMSYPVFDTSRNVTDAQFVTTLGACASCPRNTSTAGSGSTSRDSCLPCDAHSVSLLWGRPCLCNAGYSRNQSSAGCEACAAGTYKPLRSLEHALFSPCLPCAGNGTSGSGNTKCSCPRNTWGSGLSGVCTLCHLNALSSPPDNELADSCLCEAGFYGNGTQCTACPSNSTSLLGQARESWDCHCVGNFFLVFFNTSDGVMQSECTACPPASQSAPASVTEGNCSCIPGTYGDPSKRTKCTSCGANTNSTSGATSSAWCFCDDDSYGNLNSTKQCLRCPANSTRHKHANPRNSSISDCVCSKGYFGSAFLFACTLCPVGTFNPNAGAVEAGECLACPVGTFSQAGATASSDCVRADGSSSASCLLNGTCLSR